MNKPSACPVVRDAVLLGMAAGEFSRRLAGGETPGIEEYARQYPQLANVIREVFPALQLMQTSRVAGAAVDDPAAQPSQTLGDFRILREIGRGGMGVVYQAEQQSLKRHVALKVLPFASILKEEQLTRFKNEAQAAGSLDHDHIVHAYAVGCERGVHFFAMQYIDGQNLAQVIEQMRRSQRGEALSVETSVRKKEEGVDSTLDSFQLVGASDDLASQCRQKGSPTAPAALGSTLSKRTDQVYFRSIAVLIGQAAEALDYAHQRGVVHRDIKPSNLLLDAQMRIYITDFGLAFIEGDRNLTTTGDIIGTLRYMSPEQAVGDKRRIDHRTDIYSLGVTLYELAALTPAFSGDDHLDLLRQIAEESPPPVRCHNRRIPADLETIIEKAMSRDPADRYATAAELAAELQRFAADEPIQAARPNLLRRASRWARRRAGTLLVALATAVLVLTVLLTATAFSVWKVIETDRARELADTRYHEAQHHRRLADAERAKAEQAKERSQTLLYVADMKLASDAIANGDAPRAAELLRRHRPADGEPDQPGFEWRFFQKQVTRPDNVTLAQGGWAEDVELSSDGKWLATTGTLGLVLVYDTATWKLNRSFFTLSESVNGLAWSPDGRLLAAACADGSIHLWNFTGGSRQARIAAHDGEANDVAFSPDGTHLYSCGDDNLAKKWEVETGVLELVFRGHGREVERIALAHDGCLLATASSDESFAVWDPETAERRYHFACPEGRAVCVAFSPDGRLLAAGNIDGYVYLADVKTGKCERWFRQLDGVEALAFFSLGKWLATADRGGAVQLYQVPDSSQPSAGEGSDRPRWIAHEGRALSLAVTRDGQSLISGGRDGAVRVWTPDLHATRWYLYRDFENSDIATAAYNRLYVAGRKIYVWHLAGRRLLRSFAEVDTPWERVACSTDARMLAAFRRGQLALFDLDSLELVRAWQIDERLDPHRLAISPDGQSVALAEYTDRQSVMVYERESSQPPRLFSARQCECIAFSPDGRYLAAGDMDHARLFDLHSAGSSRRLTGHSDTLSGVAFSPDGSLLATVSHDRLLKVWRTATGEQLYSVVAHRDSVRGVDFSPDGRTIATAGDGRIVRLWHAATGQPLGTLLPERERFRNVRFSADGMRLVGRMDSGRVVVYDAWRCGSTVSPRSGLPRKTQPTQTRQDEG